MGPYAAGSGASRGGHHGSNRAMQQLWLVQGQQLARLLRCQLQLLATANTRQ